MKIHELGRTASRRKDQEHQVEIAKEFEVELGLRQYSQKHQVR